MEAGFGFGFGFGFGGRDVSDGFRQAAVVEPVGPFERREPDGLAAAPPAKSRCR
jgi:hypothetical protein